MSDDYFIDLNAILRNRSVNILSNRIAGDRNKRMEISVNDISRKRDSDGME